MKITPINFPMKKIEISIEYQYIKIKGSGGNSTYKFIVVLKFRYGILKHVDSFVYFLLAFKDKLLFNY